MNDPRHPPSWAVRRRRAPRRADLRVYVGLVLFVALAFTIAAGFGGRTWARPAGILLGALLFAFGMWTEGRRWIEGRRRAIYWRRHGRPEIAERLGRLGKARRRSRRRRRPFLRRLRHRDKIDGQPAFEMEGFGLLLLVVAIIGVLGMLMLGISNGYLARG